MTASQRFWTSTRVFLGLRADDVPDDEATEPQRYVQQQLLQMIALQGRRVPYPVLVCAVLIGAMASRSDQFLMPLLWVVLTMLVVLLRVWAMGQLSRWTHVPVAQRIQWAGLLSMLVGLAFSGSLLFESQLEGYERMVQTILLLGMSAGAVATTYGHPLIFRMYLAPVTLANALAWVLAPWEVWSLLSLQTGVAALILAYGGILASVARDNYKVLSESVLIRRQQLKSNEQLRVALHQAEQAMQAKTRFLASASHDLRQPLHTLSLLSEALLRRSLPQAEHAMAERLTQAVGSLSLQMDALLDISKLDADVVPVHERVFCLGTWLQRVSRELSLQALHKGLAFSVQVPETACVKTDPMLLERVVRNLIDNAIKYTERGAIEIQVVAGEDDDWWLSIRDSGIGIAQAEQARIFDEFYQVGNPERDRRKGLGLGLSIVSRMVDLLDVTLEVSSQLGQGSVFTLHLPAADSVELPAEEEAKSPPPLPPLHVLVVDDEEDIRLALKELLGSYGCEVTLAASTREAVIKCLGQQPDLALVDYRLKGTDDGLSAVRSLRSAVPGLPAVLVSGDTDPRRLRDAHAAGLSLVHKPLSADKLIAAMQQALQARAAER